MAPSGGGKENIWCRVQLKTLCMIFTCLHNAHAFLRSGRKVSNLLARVCHYNNWCTSVQLVIHRSILTV